MYSRSILYLIIAVSLLVIPVSGAVMNTSFSSTDTVIVNQTFTLFNSPTTPFLVWAVAGCLGIILLILSFIPFPNGEEGLISILAWIPLAFTMFTSFSVDITTGSGFVGKSGDYVILMNHTIYVFTTIAILFFIILVFAIGNTYRIWATQKKFGEVSKAETLETYV